MENQSFLSNRLLIGGLAITIVSAFFCASLYWFFRKRIYANLQLYIKQKGDLDEERHRLRQYKVEEVQKATQNFSKECLVGSGAYGNVYKGFFGEEGTLAVKKLHTDSYVSNEDFKNEVKLLAKVTHSNLVQLRGFCSGTGKNGAKILVYEYVSNGSLLDYLIGKGGRSLTWEQRVNVAITAAKGIAHLHEGNKPSIIHRDIKPSNILIGEKFQAKISDFGLVKTGPSGDDESHVSTQVKGTLGYLDPAYCATLHLSTLSDVYSFGVILLQLITGRPVVDTSGNQPTSHIIDWATPHLEKGSVGEILDATLLLEQCNTEMMLKMGQLGLRCVKKEPKERPTMTRVWKELQAALYRAETFKREQKMASERSLGKASQLPAHSRNDDGDDYSCSVSLNSVGLQRFQVEMDSFSFQSRNLRCLELDSLSFDIDAKSIS
ncbi:hypothetical protein LIER_08748 [Lithospermum erythrorhizon]|uniref:non-specific serine/threonine protein kinase n=1 Tax=Lithospermum erythrorhizon TaxID=34254 RepID=A0AAV3PEB4_LITER